MPTPTKGLTRRELLRRAAEVGVFLGLLGSGGYGLWALSRPYARDRLLPPPELRGLLEEGTARVLDARPPLAYRRGHLPRAVNVWDLDLHVWEDVPRRLAPVDRLVETMRRAGVGHERPVVVYDGGEGVWAARLLWVLDYLGHPDVRLLDGGLPAWASHGGGLTEEPPRVEPTAFEPRPRPEVLIAFDELRAALEAGDAPPVVDARTPAEFAEGHLPGARLLPAEALLGADGRFRGAHELTLKAKEAGLPRASLKAEGPEVVVYSRTGLRASLVYLGLVMLGLAPRVYDGGLAEWRHLGGPIERSLPSPGQGEEHRSTCW